MSNKLGLSKITDRAKQVAENPEALDFVHAAKSNQSQQPPASPKAPNKGRKLIIEGSLKNRGEHCQKPQQIYLRNEYAEWIKSHVTAGRGGQQITLNYLIRRGIEAVEADYEKSGLIFAEETTESA